MAGSDALELIELTSDDIASCMMLSTEAHWNQIEADWQHFIAKGRAIGMRNEAGRLVASAAALPYDGPFGYVGMVLVTADFRRRGIATRLVDCCIDDLKRRELTPVLDATAAGAEVYLKQGFRPQFVFDRWEGSANGHSALSRHEMDAAAISDLDAVAFGARRDELMAEFLNRNETRARCDQGARFAVIRRGRRAWQLGPVVANSEAAAIDLIDQLQGSATGAIFIDVPSSCGAVGQWLAKRGFGIQRSFTRMALERSEPFGKPEQLFAVAGPEFG